MFGIRSYAPVYDNSGGSAAEGKFTVEIFDAFTERGFEINPSMLAAYDVSHELPLDKFRNCQVFTAVPNSERKGNHTNTFLRF